MILNLTQHPATLDQRDAGVVDLPEETRTQLGQLLTFNFKPNRDELMNRARDVAAIAAEEARALGATGEVYGAMIGGAPYLMAPLARVLRGLGFEVVYAFSVRVSEEHVWPDGTVRKITVFKHAGFVPAV